MQQPPTSYETQESNVRDEKVSSLLLKLSSLPNWKPGHTSVFAGILDEQYDRVGPEILELWVDNCVRKYDAEESFGLTPLAFNRFKPDIPKFNDGMECGLCHGTKWVPADDQNRMRPCSCPPEARVKYAGHRTPPVNITEEIRKRSAAVDTTKPPSDPDNSLGFYLEELNGRWLLFDRSLPNGSRDATKYEVLTWRALRFWKNAFFGLKQEQEKTA